MLADTVTIMREEAAFQRWQTRRRWSRIFSVARAEPDLSLDDLAERFGEPVKVMAARLYREGIHRSLLPPLLTREENARIKAPPGDSWLATRGGLRRRR